MSTQLEKKNSWYKGAQPTSISKPNLYMKSDILAFVISLLIAVAFIRFWSFVPSHPAFWYVFQRVFDHLRNCSCLFFCFGFTLCARFFFAQVKNVRSSAFYYNCCCCIDDRVLIVHKIAHWLKIIGLTSFAFVFLLFISFLMGFFSAFCSPLSHLFPLELFFQRSSMEYLLQHK